MLTHFNIERGNSLDESKAPFAFESTLLLDKQLVPQGSFQSIKVFVNESTVLPLRIYCIRKNGNVEFCDNTGNISAIWKTYEVTNPEAEYISSLLVTADGILAGSIACKREALDLFRGIVNQRSSDLYLPSNAFVLIPQCHVAMMEGIAKAFKVTDTAGVKHTITGNLELRPLPDSSDSATVIREDTAVFPGHGKPAIQINTQFSLKDPYLTVVNRLSANGICHIALIRGTTVCDMVDCSNSKLIIKAAMTPQDASNLRVVHERGQLILKGVRDA